MHIGGGGVVCCPFRYVYMSECVCVCDKERRKFVDNSEVVCLHVCMCACVHVWH